jgi:hypothetical protein
MALCSRVYEALKGIMCVIGEKLHLAVGVQPIFELMINTPNPLYQYRRRRDFASTPVVNPTSGVNYKF